MLKKTNDISVKNKAKTANLIIKNALASCKCGRVTSVKTPRYRRASSFRTYIASFAPWLLKSPDWKQWRRDVAPASCFAQNQSYVSWCLYLEERCFLYSVGIQTTSKHWASVVSVPPLRSSPPCGRVAFGASASTLRHLAHLFLSLLRLTLP